jgi:hypothetical protein
MSGWPDTLHHPGDLSGRPLPRLEALAECVIGKPGVMTIDEALVLGKPLVLLRARGMAPVQGATSGVRR